MSERRELAALRPVAAAFRRLDIPFYLVGSVASSIHGIARSTLDVDLVAAIGERHVSELVSMLGDDYYADEEQITRSACAGRSFNVIHLETMYKIDVFSPGCRAYDETAMRRVVAASLPDHDDEPFDVAAPEDVILSKLEWYRAGNEVSERQWLDVLGVLRVQAGRLDNAYLDDWAHRLGVRDLLARARSESDVP